MRNLGSVLHLTFLLVIAFMIVTFAYLVARSYHYRLDLSQGSVYSLSSHTTRLLDVMKTEPITITAFFRESHPQRRQVEGLLREYSYRHRKLKFEFFDPDRSPAKVKQFGVESYETIVIETAGRQEKIIRFSEEAITNLLNKLYRGQTQSLYFSVGHAEASLNEREAPDGLGFLKEKLAEANYEVKEITLSREQIPKSEVDLLVLAGPKVDLFPEEIELIDEFIRAGGRVLVLMDPVEVGEGNQLQDFLATYGIRLGENVVVDKMSKLFGADYLIPLVTEYNDHSITKDFHVASFFPLARSVHKIKDVELPFEVSELAWTGTGSWAESDLKLLGEGTADFDENQDMVGPISLAAAAVHPEEGWRLVVFGDSDFVTNRYLGLGGNRDLVLNTIAWLAGDEFAISIRPKQRASTPLYLKEVHQRFLFFVPVLGLPFLSVATGTGVFFWRRRYH